MRAFPVGITDSDAAVGIYAMPEELERRARLQQLRR
jgi:hypothetical protein